jgi:hypothetical protein
MDAALIVVAKSPNPALQKPAFVHPSRLKMQLNSIAA